MKRRRSLLPTPLSTAGPGRKQNGGRRHHFRTSKDSKTARWRSHRGSRAIRRRPTSEIGLAWLTASNSRYCWIAGARCRSVMYWQRRAGETWPSRANSPWSVTSPDRTNSSNLWASARTRAIRCGHPSGSQTGSGVKAGGGTPTPPQRYRLTYPRTQPLSCPADPFADPHNVLLRLKSSGAVSSSRQRGDQKLISCG